MGFLLEQARRRRLLHLLDDFTVAHGDPKKVQAQLRKDLRMTDPRKKRSGDGFAALAEQLGDHKRARRMRIEDSVLAFLQRERKGAEA